MVQEQGFSGSSLSLGDLYVTMTVLPNLAVSLTLCTVNSQLLSSLNFTVLSRTEKWPSWKWSLLFLLFSAPLHLSPARVLWSQSILPNPRLFDCWGRQQLTEGHLHQHHFITLLGLELVLSNAWPPYLVIRQVFFNLTYSPLDKKLKEGTLVVYCTKNLST